MPWLQTYGLPGYPALKAAILNSFARFEPGPRTVPTTMSPMSLWLILVLSITAYRWETKVAEHGQWVRQFFASAQLTIGLLIWSSQNIIGSKISRKLKHFIFLFIADELIENICLYCKHNKTHQSCRPMKDLCLFFCISF